ncbi:hypothetical protein QQ045_019569 [Rhodiola kirilowii]
MPPTHRERSRDLISILDLSLTHLGEKAGEIGDQLEELETKVDTLVMRVDRLEEEVPAIHEPSKLALSSIEEKMREEFRGELTKTKHGTPPGTVSRTLEVRPIDAPKRKSFGGLHNARDIDNFLWGLEQYFEATWVVEESTKIRMTSLYLMDTAMLWMRRSWGEKTPHVEAQHGTTLSRPKDKGKTKEGAQSLGKPNYNKCFLCGGPHRAKDCQQKKVLNAIFASHQGTSENGDEGRRHCDLELKEAMEGAPSRGGSIKTVNSPTRPNHGIARGVEINAGTWEGRPDFTIVPMDDFKVIIGLDFHDQVKVFSVPFNNTMCILDGNKACIMPITRFEYHTWERNEQMLNHTS